MQSRHNSIVSSPDGEFSDAAHSSLLKNGLYTFFQKNMYTDVTIRIQGVEYKAHRVVLASCSPYFNAMFTSTLGEPKSDLIEIKGTSTRAFIELLEYMYTGNIDINEENIEELLETCCLFQVVSVKNACQCYLKSQLVSENCIGIRYIAERFSCAELLGSANDFIVENFNEVMDQNEFLEVPHFELIALIKQEELNVKDEVEVMDCCLKWYCHKKDERLSFMKQIFEFVKLPLIPFDNVKRLMENFPKIVQECSSMFEDLQLYHANPEQFGARDSFQFIPRKSTCLHSVLYLVGGEMNPGRTTVNTVQKYDMFRRNWVECPPMQVARRGAGVVLVQGCMYVFGGSDGYEALSTFECFDPIKNIWIMLPPMHEVKLEFFVQLSRF